MTDTIVPIYEIDYTEIELGMTNFDHSIDDGLETALKAGKVYGSHAGREFYGAVYWREGEFHEDVRRYGAFVGSFSAPTLKELMATVNDEWGWE